MPEPGHTPRNPFAVAASGLTLLVAGLVTAGALSRSFICVALGLDPFLWVGPTGGFDLAAHGAVTVWPVALLGLAFVALSTLSPGQVESMAEAASRAVLAYAIGIVAAAAGLLTITAFAPALIAIEGADRELPRGFFLAAVAISGAVAGAVVGKPHRRAVKGACWGRFGDGPAALAILGVSVSACLASALSEAAGGFMLGGAPTAAGLLLQRARVPRWWSPSTIVVHDGRGEQPRWDLSGGRMPARARGGLRGFARRVRSHGLVRGAGVLIAVGGGTALLPRSLALTLLLVGTALLWASSRPGREYLLRVRRTATGQAVISCGVATVVGVASFVPAQLTPWHRLPGATLEPGGTVERRVGLMLGGRRAPRYEGLRVGIVVSGANASAVVTCNRSRTRLAPGVVLVTPAERGQLILGERFTVRRSDEPTLLGTIASLQQRKGAPFSAPVTMTLAAIPHGPRTIDGDACDPGGVATRTSRTRP